MKKKGYPKKSCIHCHFVCRDQWNKLSREDRDFIIENGVENFQSRVYYKCYNEYWSGMTEEQLLINRSLREYGCFYKFNESLTIIGAEKLKNRKSGILKAIFEKLFSLFSLLK